MRRVLLACLVFAATGVPAFAAPWVKGFVVTHYEPAWYYGGNPEFRKHGVIEPGSDCPKGNHPDLDYPTMLRTPWRTDADVQAFLNPPHTALFTHQLVQQRGLTFRGFRDGVDVYLNPFAAPDPGMQEPTGRIAEGFDLDNNPNTGGFIGPDGRKGIDNSYYRAFGCTSSFRGVPYQAALSLRANDQMIEGLYTMVIRIWGNKDPMNDDEATLEVGYSPDHQVEGPGGVLLSDYSFRLLKTPEYSKVAATVHNGVIEIQKADELHAPRFAWYPNQYGDADFHHAQLRLSPDGKGGVYGLVGGYRDWREIFSQENFTQAAAATEMREHYDSIGFYYSLKRNADGLMDPRTRQKAGISIAYRITAVPAFVVDSSMPFAGIASSPSVKREIEQYQAHRSAFLTALATLKVQPIPAGSLEAAVGRLLHKPDGSWKRIDIDDPADAAAERAAQPAQVPERQVNNKSRPGSEAVH